MDNANNKVYISASSNHQIRVVDLATGFISTFAGILDSPGINNIDGSGFANVANFNNPAGLALDSAGNVYVADSNNNCIRIITVNTNPNIVRRFAGTCGPNGAGFSGDGGPALNALLNRPTGIDIITINGVETAVIADTDNNRIRSIDMITGYITTISIEPSTLQFPGNNF